MEPMILYLLLEMEVGKWRTKRHLHSEWDTLYQMFRPMEA